MNTIIRNEVELKEIELKLKDAQNRQAELSKQETETLVDKQRQESTMRTLQANILEYTRLIADYKRS
jgi:hypothetical protein